MRLTEWLPYTALLLLLLPFWLFDRLLRKRRREQKGYGNNNSYQGPPTGYG
ncbi:MAG TPA: hypothetical protein VH592_15785 [Gemmataceae bacterium]|jgi:hypothetical protein